MESSTTIDRYEQNLSPKLYNELSSSYGQNNMTGKTTVTLNQRCMIPVDLDKKIVEKEANSSLCVRRIMILHDNLQFDEAKKFISKLSHLTFSKVIRELPIGSLMATFPGSIKILEIIFTRFNCLDESLKLDISFNKVLQPDRFVINLVKLFALQIPSNGKGPNGLQKNGLPLIRERFDSNHPIIISSRNILKIIMIHQPSILKDLANRKASLDEALQGLSNHGLVGAVDQSLTSLHDALRLEILSVIDNYKDILFRLENLKESGNHSKKTAILRSISRATTARLHLANSNSNNDSVITHFTHNNQNLSNRRSSKLKLEELQDRLIANQVLLNIIEPITIYNQPLQELILTLQQRINYDKQVLSQFNQIRKEFNGKKPRPSESMNDSISSIFPTLSIFAFGYNQVLNLINEISTLSTPINSEELKIKSSTKIKDTTCDMEKELKCDDVIIIKDINKKDHRSDLDHTCLQNHFALNCQKSNQYDTIIHRSEYQKNRKMIQSLFSEKQSNEPESSISSSTALSNSLTSPVNNSLRGFKKIADRNLKENYANCLVKIDEFTDSPYDSMDRNALRNKLIQAHKTINEMKEREQQLKDRLSDQAQKMILKGWKFDNLCFNEKRPTALIRRYGNLYAQARVDTLDALDNLKTLKYADDLKAKLLFSLVVLSFCSVEQSLSRIKQQVRQILRITNDLSSIKSPTITEAIDGIDTAITSYLRLSLDTFDPRNNVEEVLSQICATLYDYPCLRNCDGLLMYIKDCVTLAWALIIQSTPFTIEYGCRTFDDHLHIRFHTSNQSSNIIKCYLWPSLLETPSGPCVHKGVVIT